MVYWNKCETPESSHLSLQLLQVAEEVESQLQKYKAAVDEINSKTAGNGADKDGVLLDHDELLKRNTQNLMSAVSSLPELQVGRRFGWGFAVSA